MQYAKQTADAGTRPESKKEADEQDAILHERAKLVGRFITAVQNGDKTVEDRTPSTGRHSCSLSFTLRTLSSRKPL